MTLLKSHDSPEMALIDHLRDVAEGCRGMIDEREFNLRLIESSDLADLAYVAGICHDFGKATPFFQRFLEGQTAGGRLSSHGMLSALFTHEAARIMVPDEPLAAVWMYLAVRHHHGNLQSPQTPVSPDPAVLRKQWTALVEEHGEEVESIYEALFDGLQVDAGVVIERTGERITGGIRGFEREMDKTVMKRSWELEEDNKIESFLLCSLLYSVLVDSDKRSASGLDEKYFEDSTRPQLCVDDFLNHLRSTNPDKFSPDIAINCQRNRFYSQVTEHEDLNPKNHLYTLTAPTGIGKTFAAYSVTSRLKDRLAGSRHVIYSLPFTSIIDQNFDELARIVRWQDDMAVEPRYLLKHHYLALAGGDDGNDDYRERPLVYLRDKMQQETWESGYVVTTFVQLFHSIIGYRNRMLKKFHNIVNGIVVLDEIQNLPPGYHRLVRRVFRVLAERFDTYFVLMTATQPEIFDQREAVELGDAAFFEHELFNRVKGEYRPEQCRVDQFPRIFNDTFDGQNALVVTNTKRSALDIYHRLNDRYQGSIPCYCLTTYLTPQDRRQRIREISGLLDDGQPVICVSTQLIEAGVDVSFEYVYRDSGPLDSVVQVAGRCNRNGEYEGGGRFYVVNLRDENGKRLASYVYDKKILQVSDDVLAQFPEFDSATLFTMSREYFDRFDFRVESSRLLKGLQNLNYDDPHGSAEDESCISDFELIQDYPHQHDIVVATAREVENELWGLEELLAAGKAEDRYSEIGREQFARMMLHKKRLAEHTITISDRVYRNYEDSDHIREAPASGIEYVPHELLEAVYSGETGLNPDPDQSDLKSTRML